MTSLKGKKTLVAYFSWSGNTKEAAHYIAQKVGADKFEIIREKAYPMEYNACTEDAKAEKEAGERPAIKGKVENMAQYDVVFVCVPVWWYTAPMPVYTFLEQYDLSGKTVIPFCTAYSGPSSTLRDIVSATPKSDHRDGICVVTKEQGGKDMDKKHGKIDKWLTEIGF
jgi:flavodoxin